MALHRSQDSAIRRSMSLVLFCLVSVAGACTQRPCIAPDEAETAYEAYLDEQLIAARIDAAKARGALGQLDDAIGEIEGVPDFIGALSALGDPESRIKQIAVRRKAFLAAEATDVDRRGLDHLIAGRYKQAAAVFDASWHSDRSRGTPALLKAMALIELGDWAEALPALRAAERDDRCLPTATLLRAWAERCVASPPGDHAAAGLRLLEAMDDLPPIEFDLESAIAERLVYNESQALYWAQGAAYNLRHERFEALIAESKTTDDPQRALALRLALGEGESIQSELARLAARFPDDDLTRRHLAILEIQELDNDALREQWPGIRQRLRNMAAAEPRNGFYQYMLVKPITDYDEVERDDGRTDFVDISKPYTPHEIAAIRRAANAQAFEHPGDTVRRDVMAIIDENFGAFFKPKDLSQLGFQMLRFNRSVQRYENTFKQMAETQRLDDAVEIGSLLTKLADRAVPSDVPVSMIRVFSAAATDYRVATPWTEHAETTANEKLMRLGLELLIQQHRRSDIMQAILEPELLVKFMPIKRMRVSIDRLKRVMLDADSKAFAQLHAWQLNRLDEDAIGKLMGRLEDGMADEGKPFRDDTAVMRLADLGHEPALPLLRRLAGDERLYFAELASWAIERIEGQKEKSE